MKRLLVGSLVGDWMLTARDRWGLWCTLWSAPEKTGMLLNDHLAAKLVASICRPGRVFVDVGAHIGSMIASAKRRSSPALIVAIEAIPDKVAALRRRFPDVEVVECAVGDGGEREVAFFVDVEQSGYSSLASPTRRTGQLTEIRVQLRSLGAVIGAHHVDVIKIDVEGAELGALRSARELLARVRPTVMFESAPGAGERLGHSTTALWEFLDELGYSVIAPDRLAHNGAGMSLATFNDAHLYPRRTTNFFAVAHERRIELRDRARAVLGIRADDALDRPAAAPP